MSAPVIGVCGVRERARWSFWDQDAHLVADSYVAPLQRAGGLVLVLPVDERAPLELLDRIDALMLIGGVDLDPRSYGAEPEPGTEASYPVRDAFEIAMTLGALERGMPLLGICRGMQILNVALGGTLLQDLVAPDGTHPHRRARGTFEGNDHIVTVSPGSLAARAVGEEQHLAHCHHHQAVDLLGDGLVVSGRAEDGVIEAIEAVEAVEAVEVSDGGWVLGVQWHPEANDKSRLFAALCEAAAQRISKPVSPSGSSALTSTLSTSA